MAAYRVAVNHPVHQKQRVPMITALLGLTIGCLATSIVCLTINWYIVRKYERSLHD